MSGPAPTPAPRRPAPGETANTRKPWRVNRKFLDFCRTIHIYLTMLGLLVLLLFGVTGFTLNHENWFGSATPRLSEGTAQISPELVAQKDAVRVVEEVRQKFHIRGAMTSFDDLDDRYSIAFRAPGQWWDVDVEKPGGKATARIEAYNYVAVLNNLHRGQFTGAAWSWIIDLCAVSLVVAALTGLVLWLALPKRRMLGIAAVAFGTIAALLIYIFLVPGADEAKAETTPVPAAGPAANEEGAPPSRGRGPAATEEEKPDGAPVARGRGIASVPEESPADEPPPPSRGRRSGP